MTNRCGYVGSVLSCDSCGNDVIICHGELYQILSCSRKGHKVVERNPTPNPYAKIQATPKPFFVEREHTEKPSIEKGMRFSDLQRRRG